MLDTDVSGWWSLETDEKLYLSTETFWGTHTHPSTTKHGHKKKTLSFCFSSPVLFFFISSIPIFVKVGCLEVLVMASSKTIVTNWNLKLFFPFFLFLPFVCVCLLATFVFSLRPVSLVLFFFLFYYYHFFVCKWTYSCLLLIFIIYVLQHSFLHCCFLSSTTSLPFYYFYYYYHIHIHIHIQYIYYI